MRAQRDKSGGRILLGDNTSGRAVMLRSGSSLLESGFHLDSLVHTKSWLAPDLPQRNYCVSRGVSVYTVVEEDKYERWIGQDVIGSGHPFSGNVPDSDYRLWGGETSEQLTYRSRFKSGTSRMRRSIWWPLDLNVRSLTVVHYLHLSTTGINGENNISLCDVSKMISWYTYLTEKLSVFQLVMKCRTEDSVFLGYNAASFGHQIPTFQKQTYGLIFKGRNVKTEVDTWRRGHHVVSKRRDPITNWRSVKSQENEILSYTCRNLITRKSYHEHRNPSMVTVVCPHYSTRKAGTGCYKYTNFNVAEARGVATDKRWQPAVRSLKRKYTYSFSNFRRVLNVVCFFLGNFPASEFYMPTFRNNVCHILIGRQVWRMTRFENVGVFIREKAIFEPNLFPYKYPNISQT